MVDAALLTRAKTISPADRLELIGAVWGAMSPADVPVPGEDGALLHVRLADLESNPQDQSSSSADQSSWAKRSVLTGTFGSFRPTMKKECLRHDGLATPSRSVWIRRVQLTRFALSTPRLAYCGLRGLTYEKSP